MGGGAPPRVLLVSRREREMSKPASNVRQVARSMFRRAIVQTAPQLGVRTTRLLTGVTQLTAADARTLPNALHWRHEHRAR